MESYVSGLGKKIYQDPEIQTHFFGKILVIEVEHALIDLPYLKRKPLI